LRVCLSHYTADISPTQPCTFGLLVTGVLGNDSIDFQHLSDAVDAAARAAADADSSNLTTSSPVDNASTVPATNPIRMPISVTWPVRVFFRQLLGILPTNHLADS